MQSVSPHSEVKHLHTNKHPSLDTWKYNHLIIVKILLACCPLTRNTQTFMTSKSQNLNTQDIRKILSLFGSTKWIKSVKIWTKKKLNKNCLFSGLHNESPAQIKIELLTTSEKSISIRYAILVYQDQWKHNLITKTYKKQRVSIRCPILVYHKKHTGHDGYQSDSIGAMQYQINDLLIDLWKNHTKKTLSCSRHSKADLYPRGLH
jgi:hypothetical protein